jgi:tetratricopeptide (TPR) repeat protein
LDPNHYQMLNVEEDAEPVEIEAAFQRSATKHQAGADGATDDLEWMTRLQEAYRVLADSELRWEYDQARWIDGPDTQVGRETANPAPENAEPPVAAVRELRPETTEKATDSPPSTVRDREVRASSRQTVRFGFLALLGIVALAGFLYLVIGRHEGGLTGVLSLFGIGANQPVDPASTGEPCSGARDYASSMERGKELFSQKQYREAEYCFDQAITFRTTDAEAYYLRGWAKYRDGEYAGAIADLNVAIIFQPDYCLAQAGRAWAYSSSGQPDRAITELERFLYTSPACAEAYGGRANAYLFKGELSLAIADLDQALKYQPRSVQPYLMRGWAYFSKRDYPRAKQDYDAAIAIDSTSYEAYSERGLLNTYLIEYAAAIADLDRAISIRPESAEPRAFRAFSYERIGKGDLAVVDCDAVAVLPAGDGTADFWCGMVFQSLRQNERAIASLKTALQRGGKASWRSDAEQLLLQLQGLK